MAGQRVIISSFTLAITLHTNRTIGVLSYIPKREGVNGWVVGWVVVGGWGVGGGGCGKGVKKWHSGEWQEREQIIILWNRTAWLQTEQHGSVLSASMGSKFCATETHTLIKMRSINSVYEKLSNHLLTIGTNHLGQWENINKKNNKLFLTEYRTRESKDNTLKANTLLFIWCQVYSATRNLRAKLSGDETQMMNNCSLFHLPHKNSVVKLFLLSLQQCGWKAALVD